MTKSLTLPAQPKSAIRARDYILPAAIALACASAAYAGADTTFDPALQKFTDFLEGSGGKIITVLSLAGGLIALASGRFALGQVAVPVGVLGLTSVLALGAAATRDETLVLVPITSERVALSSGSIEAHYLELVTRDTALMLLNRAPESLDYWMEQILKVADPAARGHLKAELVRIVDEQRGSDISQAFVIASMRVDTEALTSTVTGTLKTFVGAQVIASQERSFEFTWNRRGLSLGLAGFRQLQNTHEEEDL